MASFLKRYRLVYLAVILLLVNTTVFYLANHYRFDSIVVHHSASAKGNYQSIKAFHTSKKWMRDAAYHLVLSNGSSGVPMGHLEATSRYRYLLYSLATRNIRYNLTAIHICLIGNYQESPVPKSMQPIIGHVLKELMEQYHIPMDKVLFHRDIGSTVCPGKYITKTALSDWMARGDQCPDAIKKQQRAIINHAGSSVWIFPKPVIVLMAIISLLLAVVWVSVLGRFRKEASKMDSGSSPK